MNIDFLRIGNNAERAKKKYIGDIFDNNVRAHKILDTAQTLSVRTKCKKINLTN